MRPGSVGRRSGWGRWRAPSYHPLGSLPRRWPVLPRSGGRGGRRRGNRCRPMRTRPRQAELRHSRARHHGSHEERPASPPVLPFRGRKGVQLQLPGLKQEPAPLPGLPHGLAVGGGTLRASVAPVLPRPTENAFLRPDSQAVQLLLHDSRKPPPPVVRELRRSCNGCHCCAQGNLSCLALSQTGTRKRFREKTLFICGGCSIVALTRVVHRRAKGGVVSETQTCT